MQALSFFYPLAMIIFGAFDRLHQRRLSAGHQENQTLPWSAIGGAKLDPILNADPARGASTGINQSTVPAEACRCFICCTGKAGNDFSDRFSRLGLIGNHLRHGVIGWPVRNLEIGFERCFGHDFNWAL
jgi:hypothetical protein